jgi:hypothetical protein
MRARGRINRLLKQARRLARETRPALDLDAEADRWDAALAKLAGLIGEPGAVGVVRDFLQQELDSLCRLAWPLPGCSPSGDSLAELRRYPQALLLVIDRTPPEMRAAVVTSGALTENRTGGNPWLGDWLLDATRLACRTPPDLAHEAMAELLAVLLERPPRYDTHRLAACTHCGLPWPRRKRPPGVPWAYVYPLPDPPPWAAPEIFGRCVHCGCEKHAWPSWDRQDEFPWQGLARAELGPGG